jgi:putative flippase GtrA
MNRYLKFILSGLPSFILALPLNYFLVTAINIDHEISYAIVILFQVAINYVLSMLFVFDVENVISATNLIHFVVVVGIFRLVDWWLYVFFINYTDLYFLFIQFQNVLILSVVKYFILNKRYSK